MVESLVVTPEPHLRAATTDGSGDTEPARVLLLMEEGRNRRLLADWLEGTYDVATGTSEACLDDAFDLCIIDEVHFRRFTAALDQRKGRHEPIFLPVLLVVTDGDSSRLDPEVWEYVDDLIAAPIRQAELRARLANLVQRRRTSARLAERERALAETVAELKLKERAMDAAPSGVTITDPSRPGNPTIYVNGAFERLTGYDREDVLQRNMRFLQGPGTDEAAVAELRDAVEQREPASVTLLNYRADGTRFWNRVDVAPVHDASGELINFVGFQTDVTDETIREQRLSVLNRLMRHNLSNDLNVIQGHADLLLDALDDPAHVEAVSAVLRAAEGLEQLSWDVHRIERTLERFRAHQRPVDVGSCLAQVCESVEDARPDLTLSLKVVDGPWHVTGNCLVEVFEELLDNAVQYNDADEPVVRVRARPTDDGTDRLVVRVEDNGPGIPDGVVDVLRDGEETQLKHGDGVGLWLVYWVVTLLGGAIDVESGEDSGTVVSLVLPVSDEEEL